MKPYYILESFTGAHLASVNGPNDAKQLARKTANEVGQSVKIYKVTRDSEDRDTSMTLVATIKPKVRKGNPSMRRNPWYTVKMDSPRLTVRVEANSAAEAREWARAQYKPTGSLIVLKGKQNPSMRRSKKYAINVGTGWTYYSTLAAARKVFQSHANARNESIPIHKVVDGVPRADMGYINIAGYVHPKRGNRGRNPSGSVDYPLARELSIFAPGLAGYQWAVNRGGKQLGLVYMVGPGSYSGEVFIPGRSHKTTINGYKNSEQSAAKAVVALYNKLAK